MRLLALGVALALPLGACGDAGTSSTETATATSTTTVPAAKGELIFFNPIRLPSGVTVNRVTLQRGKPEPPSWSAKLGRRNGDDKFRDVVAVSVTQPGKPREISPSEEKASRRVDVNGQRALASDTPFAGATVSWYQDGYEVGVTGKRGAGDDVLAVARRVKLAEAGHAEKTRLNGTPPGMELIGEWGTTGYPRNRYSISAVGDEAHRGIALHMEVNVFPDGFPAHLLGFGSESETTRQVRGHDAYVSHHSTEVGGRKIEQVTLTWAERPDLVVTIGGVMSEDDAVAVAEGLRGETEQEWRSHLPVEDRE